MQFSAPERNRLRLSSAPRGVHHYSPVLFIGDSLAKKQGRTSIPLSEICAFAEKAQASKRSARCLVPFSYATCTWRRPSEPSAIPLAPQKSTRLRRFAFALAPDLQANEKTEVTIYTTGSPDYVSLPKETEEKLYGKQTHHFGSDSSKSQARKV